MKRRNLLISGFGAVSAAAAFRPSVVRAQDDYPSRPVRIVVANPPGGVGDLITRAFGEKAGAELGQAFVVENRPGASTVIGTQSVARAEPNGYTLLNLTTSGVVQTVLQDKLPYNLERDLVPVIGIGYFPMVLAVSAASNIRSMDDLATIARSSQGLVYGSGGTGTMAHLAALSLLKELGGHGTHVPYRGNSEAIQGLLGGQIQMFFPSTLETMSLKDALKPLAVTSAQRFPGLPDVPTTAELGLPHLNPKLWFAFLAPANTPKSVVSRLYNAFAKVQTDEALKRRLTGYGFELEIKDSAASLAYIQEEAKRWAVVVKANNIRMGD
jgi:tripartite-type tricarboxylate transporter receptor subunit TctC